MNCYVEGISAMDVKIEKKGLAEKSKRHEKLACVLGKLQDDGQQVYYPREHKSTVYGDMKETSQAMLSEFAILYMYWVDRTHDFPIDSI